MSIINSASTTLTTTTISLETLRQWVAEDLGKDPETISFMEHSLPNPTLLTLNVKGKIGPTTVTANLCLELDTLTKLIKSKMGIDSINGLEVTYLFEKLYKGRFEPYTYTLNEVLIKY